MLQKLENYMLQKLEIYMFHKSDTADGTSIEFGLFDIDVEALLDLKLEICLFLCCIEILLTRLELDFHESSDIIFE